MTIAAYESEKRVPNLIQLDIKFGPTVVPIKFYVLDIVASFNRQKKSVLSRWSSQPFYFLSLRSRYFITSPKVELAVSTAFSPVCSLYLRVGIPV
jgi:hypothetical protein